MTATKIKHGLISVTIINNFDEPTEGVYCDDIDECTENTHRCDNNADCGNTVGSYQCRCRIGFEGDGQECVDSNECVPGHNDCPDHSQCTNLMDGQYLTKNKFEQIQ